MIIEEEQHGKERAGYGKYILYTLGGSYHFVLGGTSKKMCYGVDLLEK